MDFGLIAEKYGLSKGSDILLMRADEIGKVGGLRGTWLLRTGGL